MIRRPQIPKAQEGSGDNHAVSAMKFRVLRNFLKLGYSVFLSDVDICVFDDPFKYLVRDSDIEGMSDGFDNATAYGGPSYTLVSGPVRLCSLHCKPRVSSTARWGHSSVDMCHTAFLPCSFLHPLLYLNGGLLVAFFRTL